MSGGSLGVERRARLELVEEKRMDYKDRLQGGGGSSALSEILVEEGSKREGRRGKEETHWIKRTARGVRGRSRALWA